MTNVKRLGQVPPADKVGPLTGRQYEYQHEQATVGALEMLARHDWHCVYCEWHDDFVVEVGTHSEVRYIFHQVKSKTLSQGPWTFHDLFGVSPPKGAAPKAAAKTAKAKGPSRLTVNSSAIFLRILKHHASFGLSCGGFSFVTNTGVDPTVSKLMDDVAAAESHEALGLEPRALFDRLLRGYLAPPSPLVASAEELFAHLRSFRLTTEAGSLKPESALNEIFERVFEYSEIDLKMAERKKIATQLVNLGRSKATTTTVKAPVDDAFLRAKKGVIVAEILGVLSLSSDGYAALLAAGADKELVKTLSRLERFTSRTGSHAFIKEICSFKAQWDVWRTAQRHRLTDADYVSIVARAQEVLDTGKSLTELIPLAKEAAASISPSLPAGIALDGEQVLGLLFSLAADAEPK